MSHGGFRQRLELELQARRARNRRYSLRAFAALLGTDHSSLSQILKGSRPVPLGRIRAWATVLGMDCEEAAAYMVAARVPDPDVVARQEHLGHWSAEAISVVNDKAHREILRLCRTPAFRPDCRWIADQIGVSVDDVNLALSRLLRLRLLEIGVAGQWCDNTSSAAVTEREFRKLALARIRETAAEMTKKSNHA